MLGGISGLERECMRPGVQVKFAAMVLRAMREAVAAELGTAGDEPEASQRRPTASSGPWFDLNSRRS